MVEQGAPFGADGRVLSQQIHGRTLDWTAPTPPPAPEPPPNSGRGCRPKG